MRVTVDINVLLDVFQQREPHYAASAQVTGMVAAGTLEGVCPAHGLTTLYFLIRRYGTKPDAEVAIDHVLRHFRIASLDARGWKMARNLALDDFEDATVAAVAQTSDSHFIITRNKDDFYSSPVLAITPAEFLSKFPAEL